MDEHRPIGAEPGQLSGRTHQNYQRDGMGWHTRLVGHTGMVRHASLVGHTRLVGHAGMVGYTGVVRNTGMVGQFQLVLWRQLLTPRDMGNGAPATVQPLSNRYYPIYGASEVTPEDGSAKNAVFLPLVAR